ncbi:MAG: response regulator transcription factor [Armatimonadetes bacterium]|nr:response regulator transcription factor [Armatimonadota bacterium]
MRVVLADDHPLVRSGIRTTLMNQARLEVVAEASTGEQALQAVVEHRPDLLVLDVSMPGLAADQVISRAREVLPELKTLILTAYDDDAYVRRLTQVPISGYLLKDEAPETLLQAILVIKQGGVWFSRTIADKLMGFSRSHADDPFPALSARERELLALIARGLDNQFIATELNLAEQTVRNYASTIYQKIGVNSRVEAVVWARERGLK